MAIHATTTKKVNHHPFISVNKLAEYIYATTPRRKRILLDAKYPAAYITTRYKKVRALSKSYMIGDISKAEVLHEIKTFEKAAKDAAKIPDNEYQVGYNNQSAEALIALLDTKAPRLYDALIQEFDDDNKKMIIKGVAVSVNPDLIIKADIKDIINVGAIKFHFTQTTQLNQKGQQIVSIMVHEFIKKHGLNTQKGEIVNHKLCFSFDVFKQQFEMCPKLMKQTLNHISDACEEIASRWDSL